MILRQEKPRPDYYAKKEKVRYAIFPTRLKRGIDDKTGEIIWLEKYVTIYNRGNKTSKKTWAFDRSLRLSVHVLNKLAEDSSKDKMMDEYGGSTAGAVGMLAPSQLSAPKASLPPPMIKE